MQTIGFTNKFYTLWSVSEPYKEYVDEYNFYWKVDKHFQKNLSHDLETAKSKLVGEFNIDLELRGQSTFSVRTSEKINETPKDVFKYGRYQYTKIEKCDDLSYVFWYYRETFCEVAEAHLLNNDFVKHNDVLMSPDYYDKTIKREKAKKHIDSLESGHLFTDGERIDLEIKEVGSFSFEGNYGTMFVVTYETKNGEKLKYMGSRPADILTEDFTSVKATISHSEYKGEKETKLKRIKITK